MKLITILMALMISPLALAEGEIQFGGLLGFRSSQTDTDIRGASTSSRSSYQFGVLALFPIANQFEIRSGVSYTQRYTEIKNTAQGLVSIDYSYFDVPMTVAFRFSDAASVFAGPVISFNQGKEVSCSLQPNCAAVDVKSVIMPLQLGVSFKFMPQAGAELYYEYISGYLSANVQNIKTVGANFIYYFE